MRIVGDDLLQYGARGFDFLAGNQQFRQLHAGARIGMLFRDLPPDGQGSLVLAQRAERADPLLEAVHALAEPPALVAALLPGALGQRVLQAASELLGLALGVLREVHLPLGAELLGSRRKLRIGPAKRDRQGHESLLCSVVQVALDAPSGVVAGGNYARA